MQQRKSENFCSPHRPHSAPPPPSAAVAATAAAERVGTRVIRGVRARSCCCTQAANTQTTTRPVAATTTKARIIRCFFSIIFSRRRHISYLPPPPLPSMTSARQHLVTERSRVTAAATHEPGRREPFAAGKRESERKYSFFPQVLLTLPPTTCRCCCCYLYLALSFLLPLSLFLSLSFYLAAAVDCNKNI